MTTKTKLKESTAAPKSADASVAPLAPNNPVVLSDLATTGKLINERWEAAKRAEATAQDHRLATALLIVEAHTKCEASKVNWKKWAEAHITAMAYETVRELLRIGKSDNPAGALAASRAKKREGMAKSRKNGKSKTTDPQSAGNIANADAGKVEAKVGLLQQADNIVRAMPHEGANEWLKATANKRGMVMVTPDKLKPVGHTPSDPPLARARAAWQDMSIEERAEFLDWAAADQARTLSADPAGELPDFLKRGQPSLASMDAGSIPAAA